MNTHPSGWGHCSHCDFFDSPARRPLGGEEASCAEPNLAKFHLRVFGMGGCTQFMLRRGLTDATEAPLLTV